MFAFSRLSLTRQFLLVSSVILLVGMLVIGMWVGQQIEQGVLQRTSALTALYVESMVAHHLPPPARIAQFDEEDHAMLDELFTDTNFSRQIVSFRLWSPDGHIIYSPASALEGKTFPPDPGVSRAFAGEVQSRITTLNAPDNTPERAHYSRLIETYAPVRARATNNVLAVAEFYQKTDDLDSQVQAAQQQTWAVVGVATLAMYLLLAGFVGRAGSIINRQQSELQEQVAQLKTLLEQNEQLNDRVHRAAARSAALNERFLHRLSADLHDGPCQDLGLALLRIEGLAHCGAPAEGASLNGSSAAPGSAEAADSDGDQDYRTIQTALRSALSELRTISTGLWLPSLEGLTPSEVAERAIRDYEGKTRVSVTLSAVDLPEEAPLPVKITLYRVLQEALMNGFRHASGSTQRVQLWVNGGHLCALIADAGAGFDPRVVAQNGHLGLAGMRERVELLGGAFDVQSTRGQGTTVQARLPLTLPEDSHG